MEEGTIIHVDYDLYNADSGDLIETTREDVAKEHEMHQENRSYDPKTLFPLPFWGSKENPEDPWNREPFSRFTSFISYLVLPFSISE